jgi:hypothetical protein
MIIPGARSVPAQRLAIGAVRRAALQALHARLAGPHILRDARPPVPASAAGRPAAVYRRRRARDHVHRIAGLLLMLPDLFKIAGELTPFCLHAAARTIATHALSITRVELVDDDALPGDSSPRPRCGCPAGAVGEHRVAPVPRVSPADDLVSVHRAR